MEKKKKCSALHPVGQALYSHTVNSHSSILPASNKRCFNFPSIPQSIGFSLDRHKQAGAVTLKAQEQDAEEEKEENRE